MLWAHRCDMCSTGGKFARASKFLIGFLSFSQMSLCCGLMWVTLYSLLALICWFDVGFFGMCFRVYKEETKSSRLVIVKSH